MDIKKKNLRIFDRNIKVEMFDTDINIVSKDITKGKHTNINLII